MLPVAHSMKPATMKPAQLSVLSSATAVIAGEKADRDISPKDMGETDAATVPSILLRLSFYLLETRNITNFLEHLAAPQYFLGD